MINLEKKTVSLKKGEKVSLTKAVDTGLNKVYVGLGWDPVGSTPVLNETKPEKKGFFTKLFGGGSTGGGGSSRRDADIDCDAWVACYSSTGQLVKTVYFGDKNYQNGSTMYVHHQGDNLTGEGDGDDEVIDIYLANLPENVTRVTVGVTIYSAIARHQTFDMIQNLFVRVVDTRDGFEICRFDNSATSQYPGSLSFIVGNLVRESSGWEFKAEGQGTKDATIGDAIKNYRY